MSAVALGLDYVSVSLNGYQWALNTNQVKQLNICGALDGLPNTFYDDEIMLRCHNFAYYLDMTRFGVDADWYGSGE